MYKLYVVAQVSLIPVCLQEMGDWDGRISRKEQTNQSAVCSSEEILSQLR